MQSAESAPVLSVRRIVMTGILAAIAILLGVTRIGYIPVPNLTGSATIMHVPVIIGAILEGPLVGTLVGLIFGISSFLQATDPIFKDPLVSIVPRLFIGVATYYTYAALRGRNEYGAVIAGSVAGTLTNTILVVGMIILRGYYPAAVIIPAVIPQAVAEVVLAAVITVAVVAAWKNLEGGRRGSSI